MKNNKRFTFTLAAIMFAVLLVLQFAEAKEPGASSAPEDFQALAPYGEWLNLTPHGLCWKPSVVSSWKPFEFGRWVWTEFGMTWLSYEPFGWVVHHYGNWMKHNAHGWIWIPAKEWSPARVNWIRYGQTVAWAPAPPPGLNLSEPWEPAGKGIWNIVSGDKLDRDDIRLAISETAPARPEALQTILKTPPDKSAVQTAEATLRKEGKLSRIEFSVALTNRLAAQRADVSRNILRLPKKQGKAPVRKERPADSNIN